MYVTNEVTVTAVELVLRRVDDNTVARAQREKVPWAFMGMISDGSERVDDSDGDVTPAAVR